MSTVATATVVHVEARDVATVTDRLEWTIPSVIEAWLLQPRRSAAGSRHNLELWDRFVTEQPLPWCPNEVSLPGWVRAMTESGVDTTTVARWAIAMRSLCKYAARAGAIERNEVADFEVPRARDLRTTQGYDRWGLDLDGHPGNVVAGLIGAEGTIS